MNTKLIIALVAVGILAVTLVGLAAAQLATTPAQNGTAPNGAVNNGFFGWIGRCFGYGGTPYTSTQTPATGNQPLNITVTDPNTNTTTSYQVQPGYGMPYYQNQPQNVTVTNPNTGTTTTYQAPPSYYGYGRGGCMGGFFP
jgi:hypothetical protein